METGTAQPSDPPRTYQQSALVGLWTLVVVLVVQFAYFSAGAAVRPSNGFLSYYTATQLAAEGAEVSRFYDDAWFMEQARRFQPSIVEVYTPTPPTSTLLLLPLVGFNYRTARILWTVFNLLLLLIVGRWTVRKLRLEGAWLPGFIALVLVFQPLYENVSLGQAYVLLLGLLVVAWGGYRHRNDAVLGIALGLMLILKVAGILLWPLLLVQRRWRALGWATASVLVLFLSTLPWLGLDAWSTYQQVLVELSAQPKWSVTAFQSLNGFVRHLLVFDPVWNPAPLVRASALGTWLPVLGFAAILGGSAYVAAKKHSRDDLIFAAFVVANIILSPFSTDYHYTLLLLPLAIMIVWAREESMLWIWIALGASIVLIANNLPHQSPRLSAGILALLAYPKLYGALLLWGLALWACLRRFPSGFDAKHPSPQ